MRVVRVVAVDHPLLQLAPLADPRAEQFVAPRGQPIAKFVVHAQGIGGLDRVVEQIPNQLLIVRDAVFARAMFGRVAIGGDERPVGQRLEPVEPEFAHLFHHRVGQRS